MAGKAMPKRKRGRPRTINRLAIMKAVCERISQGELVLTAAKAEGTTARQIRRWAQDEELGPLYARAREDQAHAIAEDAIHIADGTDAVTAVYEDAIEQEDARLLAAESKARYKIIGALRAELVNRDRMRVDTRKWMASKIAPRLYGERLDVTSGDKPLAATQTIVIGGQEVKF